MRNPFDAGLHADRSLRDHRAANGNQNEGGDEQHQQHRQCDERGAQLATHADLRVIVDEVAGRRSEGDGKLGGHVVSLDWSGVRRSGLGGRRRARLAGKGPRCDLL